MTTFNSITAAKRKVEEIANTKNIFFTNEGFEIAFTSENSKEEVKALAEKLQTVFSSVTIKGRKVQSILINKVSQNVENFTIRTVVF